MNPICTCGRRLHVRVIPADEPTPEGYATIARTAPVATCPHCDEPRTSVVDVWVSSCWGLWEATTDTGEQVADVLARWGAWEKVPRHRPELRPLLLKGRDGPAERELALGERIGDLAAIDGQTLYIDMAVRPGGAA